jgi:hypothetical protein
VLVTPILSRFIRLPSRVALILAVGIAAGCGAGDGHASPQAPAAGEGDSNSLDSEILTRLGIVEPVAVVRATGPSWKVIHVKRLLIEKGIPAIPVGRGTTLAISKERVSKALGLIREDATAREYRVSLLVPSAEDVGREKQWRIVARDIPSASLELNSRALGDRTFRAMLSSAALHRVADRQPHVCECRERSFVVLGQSPDEATVTEFEVEFGDDCASPRGLVSIEVFGDGHRVNVSQEWALGAPRATK